MDRGWCTLTMPADPPVPDGTVHIVPCTADETVQNGHELHPLCWCQPVRVTGPLEDPVLSHNDPTWPGASDQHAGLVQ